MSIYKRVSKFECSNYRPISLHFNYDKIIEKLVHDKIIEKLVHKRLVEFLNDQKVLHKKQLGFQKDFSPVHTIIFLIEKFSQGNRQ